MFRVVSLLPFLLAALGGLAASEPGPFFEPEQPFFHTQLEVAPGAGGEPAGANMVVRGILVPVGTRHALVFDQELLRLAGAWEVPSGEPPATLQTMAQISYHVPRRKASGEHPAPTGPLILQTPVMPGLANALPALAVDPRRPAREGDLGRGPLPAAIARFGGVELQGDQVVLHYRVGPTRMREWYSAAGQGATFSLFRHLAVQPHAGELFVALGQPIGGVWRGPDGVEVREADEQWVAVLPASSVEQRVTFELAVGRGAPAPAPARPPGQAEPRLRWPGTAEATVELAAVDQNGWILDHISVPETNPWNRRVRVADLAFLDPDRAAVVTYDGDVWLVEGLADAGLSRVTWRRFASGLHEPLAIAAPGGIIQVATKNGLVRVHDRDGNGDADWFENFSDLMIQSQTTRSFPLDMALGPDGSSYVTQGGIVTQSGIASGGTGTSHAGAIVRISPDGRSAETVATGAREPFVTVHPETGVVTGTDQQGHYIPSSVVYLIRPGDAFGFLEENPARLTPPLVWIPHDQDSSSSSQVWMTGGGLGAWQGRLLHLSYGTGRLFLIAPDLEAPVPQGASINLGISTNLPLLHARESPAGDAVFLAGFQIYGTRTGTNWGLGRLRPGPKPIVTPLAARAVAEGVILHYDGPLDPASLRAENINVRMWNYRRSSEYGSGRYTPAGEPGTTPLGVGDVVPSPDGRAVFLHVPGLVPIMQLEVRVEFRLDDGTPAPALVHLTVHEPEPVDLAAEGFGSVDLSESVPVIAPSLEPEPSVEWGRELAETLGCLACHGTTPGEVKIGPTWAGLYRSRVTFADGSVDLADDFYLREKILEPLKRRRTLDQAEMPSYRGVVSDNQLEALVLFIRSLGRSGEGN